MPDRFNLRTLSITEEGYEDLLESDVERGALCQEDGCLVRFRVPQGRRRACFWHGGPESPALDTTRRRR